MSNRELSNRIEYFVGCIGAFAEKYSLSNSQAYKYLKRFSGLDFLEEFYDIEHTFSIEEAVDDFRQGKGVPVVSKFMFDESILNGKSDIKIKQFGGYTIEWAEFILLNRNNNTNIQAHDYDIVIGPIADDTVGLQLRRFIQGYINISQLVNELS